MRIQHRDSNRMLLRSYVYSISDDQRNEWDAIDKQKQAALDTHQKRTINQLLNSRSEDHDTTKQSSDTCTEEE